MAPTAEDLNPPSARLTESDSETGELLRSWQKQTAEEAPSRKRLNLFKKSLRIAPMFLVHTWSSVAAFVAMQPLLMEVTCKDDLGMPEKICDLLTSGNSSIKANFKAEETRLQVQVAHLMFWKSIVQNVFPLVLVLFIGSWSDRYGRKIPMMAVLGAYVVQDLGLILCNEVRSTWLTSSWGIIMFTSLVPGIVGGDQSFSMAVFNHITDTSSDDERTFLNGCAMGFIFGGVAFGYMLGGLLATTLLTYSEIFLCTMVIELGVLAYIWICLKEDQKFISLRSTGFISTLKSFGDLSLIRDTFQTLLKRRDGQIRLALLLLILAHVCANTPWMGEFSVLFIFGKFKFGWDPETYGIFTATRYILGFCGNWIAVTLLTKALRMPDASVGITSCISGLVGYTTFVFAPTTLWMYIGSISAVFDSTMQVIPRSIMSKLVPANEIGSVSAFLAVFDCIIGLASGQIYASLYSATLDTFTSAFMLLSGMLMIPGIPIYIWILKNKNELNK